MQPTCYFFGGVEGTFVDAEGATCDFGAFGR